MGYTIVGGNFADGARLEMICIVAGSVVCSKRPHGGNVVLTLVSTGVGLHFCQGDEKFDPIAIAVAGETAHVVNADTSGAIAMEEGTYTMIVETVGD
eukprot:15354748-Ditylum_brightwellii.AAC.1